VISILKEEEAKKMESLAKELGFEFSDIQMDPEEMRLPTADEDGEIDLDDLDDVEVEKLRRLFEDTLNLVNMENVPEDQMVEALSVIDVDYDDDDEDEGFQ
jgi:ribosome maturation factor RimP